MNVFRKGRNFGDQNPNFGFKTNSNPTSLAEHDQISQLKIGFGKNIKQI